MKRVSIILVLAATPAHADCTAEVRSLFEAGGPNDPFSRPPHRQVQITYGPDGTETFRAANVIETPLRTIHGMAGQCTLAVDAKYWTGPCEAATWDGPGGAFPGDRAQGVRARVAQEQANVSEAECFGPVDLNGRQVLKYRYRTQTAPAEDGGFSGERATVWIDPETNRWVRWEAAEMVTPWQPEPDGSRVVTTFVYDESIAVTPPAE
ncbi:hypothetical protein [Maritimibacter sp. UBA3975]|uniref:hypothetical protein n=1 Tax=Maritimibacter sp. UBA3975 TaxID=1946833 RepID=UPI000C0A97CD|nr:hypothetical protein [Maritimibacter sp. UBA3975]MAM63894.1 hypothetical protein [Maritimibacter sp.]|tara:strand:- start:42447 stop:43070 length:624 start_codon:yes stop_codon:yes gene_type:complete